MVVSAGPRLVRAPRGRTISCRGWSQEAALRMLMNNLDPEVAERPDDLVVYGGTGEAARSWAAFDAIVAELRALADDETLLVASGKPVAVFRTHEWAPRVLIANSNLVRPLGDLGDLPRAGARRAHHVRADDRGLVDLHRQPGHPAGHVRDVRRAGTTPFRRLAGGPSSSSPQASAAWAARSRSRSRSTRAWRSASRSTRARATAARDPLRRSRHGRPGRRADLGARGRHRRARRVHRARRQRRGAGARAGAAGRALRRGDRPDLGARRAERLRPRRAARWPRPRTCARATPTPTNNARWPRWPSTSAPCWPSSAAGAIVFDYGNNIRAQALIGRGRGRLRDPGLRARVHPAPVLRGSRAVPLGRAVGRPCRHRAHR